MYSTFLVTAKCNIGFLVDLWECRVESLWVVVVECTGLSVMLPQCHDHAAYLIVRHDTLPLIFKILSSKTWHVSIALFSSLLRILPCLDTEWVLCFIPRIETPVTFEIFSCFALFILSSLEVILPCDPSSEVIPVEVSVCGYEEEEGPEHPSHFAYHPHIGLAHIVRNVEYHCVKINIIIITCNLF